MNACGLEDDAGRVCFLGAGHLRLCRFGAADGGLTERQREFLADVASGRRTEHFGANTSAASLEKLGLLRRRPIGMRCWRVTITEPGRAVLAAGAR